MRPNPRLLVATTNRGKLNEFKKLWGEDYPAVQFLSLDDVSIRLSPEETGGTFQENAVIKSLYYSRLVPDTFVMAEDSGLVVDGLGGDPGIFSARYAGPDASDTDNIKKLLRDMKDEGNRAAGFVSALSLSFNGRDLELVTGEVRGEILREPRGKSGFGYDPVFFIPSLGKSFGEIPTGEKNRMSHRFRAFRKMVPLLISRLRAQGA